MSDEQENRYTRRAARDAQHFEARALAERLASVRHEWFLQVPLDDHPKIAEHLAQARQMKATGARRREVRFVARLLQNVDHAPLMESLDRAECGAWDDVEALHVAEAWRARLIDEGDPALGAFSAEHPAADRQRLRQLARQARKEKEQGRPPKAARALFKLIRGSLAEADEPSAEDDPWTA